MREGPADTRRRSAAHAGQRCGRRAARKRVLRQRPGPVAVLRWRRPLSTAEPATTTDAILPIVPPPTTYTRVSYMDLTLISAATAAEQVEEKVIGGRDHSLNLDRLIGFLPFGEVQGT